MAATAAPPRGSPSLPYSVVEPHDLGFPPRGNPPPAGTLSSSSGKPRHGFEPVPDTEDARTPGTSEFFLREPPWSSEFFEPPGSSEFFLRVPPGSPGDDNTPLAHTAFTHEQQVQLKAQVYVYGDLGLGKTPAERLMILAFGEPSEGQKHAWEEAWRAAVDPCKSPKSLPSGFDTPPSSSLIGSCTGEEGSKDSTVGKSTISGQDDSGEEQTQGLNVGTASIHPLNNTTEHAEEMLEQKNGDEDHLAVNCTEQVDQVLCDDGSNLKKNAICGGQTFLESHCSLPKNKPWNNMTHIQECYHSRNKSGPNSPRDIPESSSSRIGSCIAEQGNNDTSVGKTFILEQHSSKTHNGGEEESQGPDFRSDRNHPAESSIDKVDQVLSDNVNNLETNTVCGGQTLLSCFKCGKNGQLLKCHSCPIAVHGGCFSSSVRSVDGQFYCPVCFCYKATEAYKEAEKTLREASKDLSAFLMCSRFAKQEQSTRNQQSAANSKDNLNECCTSHLSHRDEESGHEKRNAASDACPEVVVTEKTTTFGQNSGRVNNNSSHEVAHSSQNRFSSTANRKLFGVNGLNMSRRRVRFQPKRTVVSHSYGKALKKQAQLMHSPARKRYYPNPPECQSSRATPARDPLASTTRHGKSTARRMATKWTRAEEAALMEGVAKFTADYREKRNISWVWVREYGKGSFNPVREPTDLKDKWKKMKRKGKS